MEDTIEVNLPISKSVVVIRNYTTNADDEKAESLLYRGVTLNQNTASVDSNVDFPLENVIASQKSYMPRLVRTIDGDDTNIAIRLKELRTEDYNEIKKAVDKIIDNHSPKVNGVKKDSKTN